MTEMIAVQKTIRYHQRAIALDWAPVVRGLQMAIDGIVQTELRRFQARLHTFTPEQYRVLQLSLSEIAIKILDPLIRSLKNAAYNGDSEKVARICALFKFAPLLLVQAREDQSISLALGQLDLMIA